ncbi:flagellar assembly protein FlgT [Photobacterium sp. CCB-ST2H9]|uniref:flagella assembly protein FlgT n=1 Tax=unclassified Photobacterium TaxID=2628852 RepID=UPI0020047ACE|nr:flagella assembly protein FlgT [Photobacterium sp. CCB-ST2H9]UTM58059.1 flagellar assembly protein FlgT [Photobacterium sp. CCB-ST2H9]
MKNTLRKALLGLGILTAMPLQAAWFEVTGQAILLESKSSARTNAIEDAVYRAMHYAGADFSSFSNLKPYLQEDRQEYQFNGTEVRHVQISKSFVKDGNYYVTARVDIYPSAKSCHNVQYKKGMLISDFSLAIPQQAALGGIYQVGKDFTQLLKRQIGKQSQSFVVTGTSAVPVQPDNPGAMMMLAEDYDAQYIVSGQITDLTSTLDQSLLSSDKINRQFSAEVQVLDGKTGEVLVQRKYREVAEWPFSRVSQVDTQSARFWVSAYGAALQRISRNIMLDLESSLACRASLPEVVNAHGNQVQVNVGRAHGVKQGDLLRLWHTAGFIDQYGISRNRMVETKITLVVDRVYENSAELSVQQNELAASIQPGDLLTKQPQRRY